MKIAGETAAAEMMSRSLESFNDLFKLNKHRPTSSMNNINPKVAIMELAAVVKAKHLLSSSKHPNII
jgi:hypothetical protein